MGKLSFKGDAPKKTKSKRTRSKPAQLEEEQAPDGWIPVPSASLAFGPIYLTHSSSSSSVPPICIALQPTTGRVYAFTLPSTTTTSTELALLSTKLEDLEEREALLAAQSSGFTIDDNVGPTDVHHVWVCTRVVDTEDKVTLRSGTGKFLACDEVGAVSAEREARGMQEEWTLHDASEGGVAIKSAYGKFLSVDILAGGKVELRADEEEEGVGERWRILMQGEFLAKAKKSKIERSGIKSSSVAEGLTIVGSLGNAENDYIQKYQARGQGRLVSSAEDVRELKRARKEGKLSEAMLERRQKLKSDRYC